MRLIFGWKEPAAHASPGAFGYSLNDALRNWSKLTVYIEDGRLKPDNNAAEKCIRPLVLSRNYATSRGIFA
jgi:hypothetical protein